MSEGKEGKNPDFTTLLSDISDGIQRKLEKMLGSVKSMPDRHDPKSFNRTVFQDARYILTHPDEYMPDENKPDEKYDPHDFGTRLKAVSHSARQTFAVYMDDTFYGATQSIIASNSIEPDQISAVFRNYFGSFSSSWEEEDRDYEDYDDYEEEGEDYENSGSYDRDIHLIYDELAEWLENTFLKELVKKTVPAPSNKLKETASEHSPILFYTLKNKALDYQYRIVSLER